MSSSETERDRISEVLAAAELRSAERIVHEQWKGISAPDPVVEAPSDSADGPDANAAEPSDGAEQYHPEQDSRQSETEQ